MNDKDPLSDSTVSLLRAPLPGRDPRPGFETRLICNLKTATAQDKGRFAWLPKALAAAALLIALLTTLPLLQTPKQAAKIAAKPPEPPQPVLEVNELPNPLRTEAQAIRNTATRASNFLISVLPSFPDPEQSL